MDFELIRFRAESEDGEAIVSSPARLRRAPLERLPAVLSAAAFEQPGYRSGDRAALSVRAENAEGSRARLFLERQEGAAWVPLVALAAPVVDGVAQAYWDVPRLPLDGASVESPRKEKVRFTAIIDFSRLESAPVEVEHVPLGESTRALLIEPHWADREPGASFQDGDEAVMRVRAPGLDGRPIRFVVEWRDGDGWKPLAQVDATAREGKAEARLAVRHPLAAAGRDQPPTLDELKGAQPVQLRFHAMLADA